VSRIFDKPLAIMSTSSYRADAGTVRGKLDIAVSSRRPRGGLPTGCCSLDDLGRFGPP
jgi:hypothetical protein